jgi:hypothetical protein
MTGRMIEFGMSGISVGDSTLTNDAKRSIKRCMRVASVWVAVGIAFLMFGASRQLSAAPAAISARSVQAFELNKGVIVDRGRGVVYLMNLEHGIDAAQLDSGKLVWHTSVAAEPLLLFEDRLVAQVETSPGARILPLSVLNIAAHGEPVLSAAVPLPPLVFASIDDGMATSFTTDVHMSSGELEVWWHFTQRAASGFGLPGSAPMPEINGAARINLRTSRVQVLPASNAPTQRRTNPNSGAPADLQLEPGFNWSISSADGQTILANKPIGTDAAGWTDYIWAIYSLQTRDQLAEIRMPTSAAPFFVWNSILVYVSRPYGRRIDGKWIQEPLELRAVDARTGREAWKTPIRDTTYHGPFPPRP